MTSTEARHVMIVEDTEELAALLGDYLEREGFDVSFVTRGDAALARFAETQPDLILLDLMLPGMDGLAVCQALRRESQVPIVMTTAKVEEIDRLLGLELGADDYICKPYSPREVVARVKTVLRRAQAEPAPVPAGAARLLIEQERYRASLDGTRLELTPTEFRLLLVLAERPGRVLSRAQLLEFAYEAEREVYDRVVDSHIKNLRRKLAAVVPEEDILRSVYGVGYSFEFASVVIA